MNILDFAIITILALCAFFGFRKGLVHTVYRFVSFFAALFLAVRLHPIVSQALRRTFVYDGIRGRIAGSANFEAVFEPHTPAQGISEAINDSQVINALTLPQPIRDLLYNNNTPAVRDILRVGTLEDFVAGFFANIAINIISILIVFILAFVILKLIGRVLNIVDRLPVISSVNRLGGLIVGIIIGAGVAWLGLTVVILFFSTAGNNMFELIQGSLVTSWMLENDWLLPRLTAV